MIGYEAYANAHPIQFKTSECNRNRNQSQFVFFRNVSEFYVNKLKKIVQTWHNCIPTMIYLNELMLKR